jgi:sarcosine oxidase, subunit gamma
MDEHSVHISVIPDRTVLTLRSWLPRDAHSTPLRLDGEELPSQVGAIRSVGALILCLAPQEWWIVSRTRDLQDVARRVGKDLTPPGCVLLDLSEGFAALEVRGPAARALLSRGCGLDFHPREFPPGRCARTRFAQIPLTIVCVDEASRFELWVTRSYLHYLHAWLSDAAVAFAIPTFVRFSK